MFGGVNESHYFSFRIWAFRRGLVILPDRDECGREAPVLKESFGDLGGLKAEDHLLGFAPSGKFVGNTIGNIVQGRKIGVSESKLSKIMNESCGIGRRGIGQLHFRGKRLGADRNAERVSAQITGFPTIAPHWMNKPAPGESRGGDTVKNFAAKSQDGVRYIFTALIACEIGGICSSQNIGGKAGIQIDQHFHLSKVGGTPLGELEQFRKNRRGAGNGTSHLDHCLEVSCGFH